MYNFVGTFGLLLLCWIQQVKKNWREESLRGTDCLSQLNTMTQSTQYFWTDWILLFLQVLLEFWSFAGGWCCAGLLVCCAVLWSCVSDWVWTLILSFCFCELCHSHSVNFATAVGFCNNTLRLRLWAGCTLFFFFLGFLTRMSFTYKGF